MEIRGQGAIPLTRTDENLTPREIEQKAAELAYFLRVPIEGYENPREATGRIVCANCHLANKPVDIEVPQAVLPDTVFEAVVRIPYDMQQKQVLANADASDGRQVVDIIPPGPELLVSEGESIKLDQPLTSNPNVGGFGQGDAEIVLQDTSRVQGLFSSWHVILAQIFLVLKKKQFEKVQLSEMNF
ncbi:hypothetical protein GIB67_010877 [Kingdonia uniflora]|uniref:Cytochrome f n=1 Tax=Kingdonia uniflora TaxID=39325 RepID=A0A7J7NCQ0_9MAGN|nr:hypothetical protein GIB67_010877 [Kingdonia uniflora]